AAGHVGADALSLAQGGHAEVEQHHRTSALAGPGPGLAGPCLLVEVATGSPWGNLPASSGARQQRPGAEGAALLCSHTTVRCGGCSPPKNRPERPTGPVATAAHSKSSCATPTAGAAHCPFPPGRVPASGIGPSGRFGRVYVHR